MNIIETNFSYKAMDTRKSTERIILHHTATTSETPEQIHNYHLSKGWSGAGYHFYVRKDGKIYRLRPENKVGAHATNHNYNSIGVCAEGDFEVETMPEVQKNALKELVSYLKNKYGINKVQRHKDVQNTSCPGRNFPFDEIVNGQAVKNETAQKTTNEIANTDILNDGVINCIYDIQEWLNNHYGFNLALDNKYGSDTHEKLVKALQTELNKQFNSGLAVDGIFGTKTKNACINVSQGASGNITMLIQMALFIKGYNLTMDKIFGTDTKEKVMQFQKANGLSADGIVGKNTFEKLFN